VKKLEDVKLWLYSFGFQQIRGISVNVVNVRLLDDSSQGLTFKTRSLGLISDFFSQGLELTFLHDKTLYDVDIVNCETKCIDCDCHTRKFVMG